MTDMDSNSKIRVEGLSDLRKNLPDAYDKLNKCIDDYRKEYGQIEFMLFEDSPSGEGLINPR